MIHLSKELLLFFSQNVTELRLSDNPAWEGDKGNTKGDKHDDLQRARFHLPCRGLGDERPQVGG